MNQNDVWQGFTYRGRAGPDRRVLRMAWASDGRTVIVTYTTEPEISSVLKPRRCTMQTFAAWARDEIAGPMADGTA